VTTARTLTTPDGDHRGLEATRGDEPDGEAFVLSFDDREQRDRGPDAGERRDDVEEGAQDHLAVSARAQDVVGVREDRAHQEDGWDRRGEGQQVEDAGDERGRSQSVGRGTGCGLSGRVHAGSP
jgi:hypothetical protein